MLERLLQSTGRTGLSMIPQITGAVINVIMDPILIFGLFGMPKLGVAGAAYATVFGQVAATIIGLYLNIKHNPEINLRLKGFKIDFNMIKLIYIVGAPAILLQAVGSIMNFGMNKILLGLDASAVAVFTVYYKLQSFFFMPLFGLNAALVPIIAYNYGAANRKRIMSVYKFALIFGFMLISIGFLSFEFIPETLLSIFNTGDKSLTTLGVPALRKIGVHYLFAWYCILTGGLFQALGNGVYSLINSLMRQLVVLLPAAFILGKIGGVDLVWWSFPIAEIMSFSVTTFFFFRINKKIIKHIPEGDS
jgi:putative MATE family efflux protein